MLHHQIEAARASLRHNPEGFPPVTDLEDSKSRVQEADQYQAGGKLASG